VSEDLKGAKSSPRKKLDAAKKLDASVIAKEGGS
jgi:hypothetical protein